MADKPTLTAPSLTVQDLDQLKAPFAVREHEFHRNNAYIKEVNVCERIESVDPSWQLEVTDKVVRDQTVTVFVSLTVKGVRRDGVGSAQVLHNDNDYEVNEAEKSAATDALKRAARLFGVGRYLLELPKNVKDERSLGNWLRNNNAPANVMNLRAGDAPSNDLVGKAAWWPVMQNDDEVTNLYNHEQHLINAIRKVAADDGIDMDTVAYSKIKKILIDRKALQTGELAG